MPVKGLRIIGQIYKVRYVIGAILLVSAIPISMAVLIHWWRDVDFGYLTRDPVVVLQGHIYAGFLSQVGIFGWAASAAVNVLAMNVVSPTPENRLLKRFLFASAALTLLLGFDDVFLLHEEVFPRFGIPEKVVYASYVVLTLAYLVRFIGIILDTEDLLLWMALSCFALSVISDLVDGPFIFEDGAKLVGIVAWLTYFFRTTTTAVRRDISRSRSVDERIT